MKYLAQLNQEFTKEARQWTDLTLDQQKDYLRRHPKSERRLSPRPEHKFRKPGLVPAQFGTVERYQSPSVKPVLAALKEKGFRVSELEITKGRGFSSRKRHHGPVKGPKTTAADFTLSRNGKYYAVHLWTVQAHAVADPYEASLSLYKKKKRPVSFPFKPLFSGNIDIRTVADTIDAYTSKKSKT
jgi:hypothetical protein